MDDVGDTPSRRRIFVCHPGSSTGSPESRRSARDTDASEDGCARQIVSTLAQRAFRRAPQDSDLDSLLGFFRAERERSGSFEAGIELALRRMLADPKARALVTNFAAQWLYLRDLKTARPDDDLFVDFDDNLRQAFQRETELLFESLLRENRSVLDLLDADYTYVNERLAKHYGIPNIYGPDFRRVTLPAELDARRGLLGKGALLTVTSAAARTSPVARGKWFLQTFLGVSPPDPPPDVDTSLKEKPADLTGNVKAPTMRQTMEAHRANPTCASCHRIFEPLGFALENFDAVGAWRTHDEGVPVDATGVIVDGTSVDGVASLR